MSKNIVILGGGTGGTMLVNHLAKSLNKELRSGEVKLTMITESDEHIYQPGYLFVSFGSKDPEHYVRPQKDLLSPYINLVVDKAEKIDKENKVIIAKNNKYSYDYLVVATGSIPRYDLVPGLAEGANNFYSMEGAIELRDKILNFEGGKIVITLGTPHKCPVAPIELYFMMHDFFEKKGIRDKVELVYTYPLEMLHTSPPVAKWVKPELDKRNIRSTTNFVPSKVDPENKVLYSEDGREETYDLLISIPAHRGSQVIFNSEGLGNKMGFIEVDEGTLKAKNDKNIYVIGDATALTISKAGSTAHYQVEYIAKNIESELKGLPPSHLSTGKVLCFIETGLDEATYITMDYKNPPKPVTPNIMLHWYKIAFNEMYWLSAKGLI